MMRPEGCKVVSGCLCVLALLVSVAHGEADSVPPAPAADAPVRASGEIIDLFGHQAADSRSSLPESQRVLRRPESPAASTARAANESRVIDRRSRGSGGWTWTDVLPLATVLGLIAIVAVVIRRFMPTRGLISQAPGLLEVVARTAVSPRQSILLVRLGRRFLLLGVSPDRITTLTVVEDAETTAELLGEVASRQTDSSTAAFAKSFRLEEAQFEEDVEADTAGSAGGHVRGLLEKIRQMKRSRVA